MCKHTQAAVTDKVQIKYIQVSTLESLKMANTCYNSGVHVTENVISRVAGNFINDEKSLKTPMDTSETRRVRILTVEI